MWFLHSTLRQMRLNCQFLNEYIKEERILMRHVPPFTKVSFERTNIKVSSIKKQDRVMSRENEKETSSRRSTMLPWLKFCYLNTARKVCNKACDGCWTNNVGVIVKTMSNVVDSTCDHVRKDLFRRVQSHVWYGQTSSFNEYMERSLLKIENNNNTGGIFLIRTMNF